jgi:hypothetical protein
MRPRHLLLPVLTTAALGLVAGCGSSTPTTTAAAPAPATSAPAAAAPPSSGPRTLTLVESPTGATFTPKGGTTTSGNPTKQPTAGDVLAFDAKLSEAGAPAGHDHVSFTYQSDGRALVQADLTLSDGTILVRGTTPVVDSITVPIVSGTGAYAGRTGSLTAKRINDGEDDLTVALR